MVSNNILEYSKENVVIPHSKAIFLEKQASEKGDHRPIFNVQIS